MSPVGPGGGNSFPLTSKSHSGKFLQNKVREPAKFCFAFLRRRLFFPRAKESGLFLMTPAQAESTSAGRPCGGSAGGAHTVDIITGLDTCG